MKKLVVGLVIGLVVGGGSIAIAQTTTTSADFCVKDNGKIRLTVDATCESGEELLTIEGAQGPPGLPGQDGTDGEDGANGIDGQDGVDGTNGMNGTDGADGMDGADGVSGYEIVEEVAQWGDGGDFREIIVYCPEGKKALGAGYSGRNFGPQPPDYFAPINNGTAWYFGWSDDFGIAVADYHHYVICAEV